MTSCKNGTQILDIEFLVGQVVFEGIASQWSADPLLGASTCDFVKFPKKYKLKTILVRRKRVGVRGAPYWIFLNGARLQKTCHSQEFPLYLLYITIDP